MTEHNNDLAILESETDAATSREFESASQTIQEIPQETPRTLDSTQLYLNEIGFSPLLSKEEEQHYSRLAHKGDEAGRKRMIESNLRLVVKNARKYLNRGL